MQGCRLVQVGKEIPAAGRAPGALGRASDVPRQQKHTTIDRPLSRDAVQRASRAKTLECGGGAVDGAGFPLQSAPPLARYPACTLGSHAHCISLSPRLPSHCAWLGAARVTTLSYSKIQSVPAHLHKSKRWERKWHT